MIKKVRWPIRLFFLIWIAFLWFYIRSPFEFIFLNTILGYIPIEISFHINSKNNITFWFLTLIWLLFYPNAPYMLTDLFHLDRLQNYTGEALLNLDFNTWFLFACLLISSISLIILGMFSLISVSNMINDKLSLNNRFSFFIISILLIFASSVGVFIGRFLGLHTISFIKAPQHYFELFINMWNHSMLVFVLILSIIQLVIYCLINAVIIGSKEG
ncbi:DUF1361 domain-containing protein [Lactobacillus sp. S2-2]|uniref:DUF1361 domain-containing protein n=1 Tax=Lactobacillus sp. S2-2 TaxID=2692917 RepID=UPI001F1B9314|nr:DUF1361 domain-containing protein [Lactobacillus sp. S2-2]MCF6514915.1 DUF1361 domain-containing protein [Lactobacillus sp. S2-2]